VSSEPEYRLTTSFSLGIGLSDEDVRAHYALIGAIATEWATFEYTVDVVLCRLAGMRAESGLCIIAQIQSVRNKLLAVEALLNLRGAHKDIIREFRRFINRMEPIMRARNRAMHDILLGDQSSAFMQFARRYVDRSLVHEYQKTSIQELKDTANSIGRHIAAFNVLMNKTIALWPPLPETPPQQPAPTPPGRNHEQQTT
jgi:hypothetical protein